MPSDAAETADAPGGWDRLDRVARSAAAALGEWRRRALQSEGELTRLRVELEALSAMGPLPSAEPEDELRRLRAENAVLSSRVEQVRERVRRLLATLSALENRK